MPSPDLLPADPIRGLTRALVAAEQPDEFGTSAFGMWTAAGAARVRAVLGTVERVLAAGCGREAALAALHGGLLRLERDGHSEYADTVVRESMLAALEDVCDAADVDAFTDDEVNEVSLLIALRSAAAATGAVRRLL